jgi:hypothetical protein
VLGSSGDARAGATCAAAVGMRGGRMTRRLPEGLSVHYERDPLNPQSGPITASIVEVPAVTGLGATFGEAYQSVVTAMLEHEAKS